MDPSIGTLHQRVPHFRFIATWDGYLEAIISTVAVVGRVGARFASDAKRLQLIADLHQSAAISSPDPLTRSQLNDLRLIARYYVYIKSNWSMTPGTREVFESTRQTILDTLVDADAVLTEQLRSTGLVELARQLPDA